MGAVGCWWQASPCPFHCSAESLHLGGGAGGRPRGSAEGDAIQCPPHVPPPCPVLRAWAEAHLRGVRAPGLTWGVGRHLTRSGGWRGAHPGAGGRGRPGAPPVRVEKRGERQGPGVPCGVGKDREQPRAGRAGGGLPLPGRHAPSAAWPFLHYGSRADPAVARIGWLPVGGDWQGGPRTPLGLVGAARLPW